jgi:nitroimidazol reductase NimA-like FMN-containing flavoprotein (pyridoxamine 5'-phosphate oxidase superfamily)
MLRGGLETTMSTLETHADEDRKAKILAILDENRIASVATVRPDGWPQVTMVGYVHDDLALYFSVARSSQKFANISHDSRVSLAVGHDAPNHIQGLSMAGRAVEVTDFDEIRRLNALLASRYPEQAVFAPREAASVLLRLTPKIVSLIDQDKGPGHPELVQVVTEAAVKPVDAETADDLMRDSRAAALVREVSWVAGVADRPI